MPFHRASGLVQRDFVNAQGRLTKADNRAGERLPVGGDNAKALFSLTFLSRTVYLYSTNRPAKPAMPEPPRAPRLLDQLRQQIRYRHYSLRTEQCYVQWVRRFIRFHGMRHPRDLGGADVSRFLSHLANEGRVAPSTHKQALCAVLFLYKQVLGVDLPWMQEIGRPRTPQRLPVVLSRVEVQRLLAATAGVHQLIFRMPVP